MMIELTNEFYANEEYLDITRMTSKHGLLSFSIVYSKLQYFCQENIDSLNIITKSDLWPAHDLFFSNEDG